EPIHHSRNSVMPVLEVTGPLPVHWAGVPLPFVAVTCDPERRLGRVRYGEAAGIVQDRFVPVVKEQVENMRQPKHFVLTVNRQGVPKVTAVRRVRVLENSSDMAPPYS